MNQLIKSQLDLLAGQIMQKAEFCPQMGLLNGKMGICIFLYHYAGLTNEQEIISLADDLIDSIYKGIRNNRSLKFEDGITGIAWGLHHLANNNFVEADMDDILVETDKICMNRIDQAEVILNDDWFGIGWYVLLRLKSSGMEKWNNAIQKLIMQLKRQFVSSRYMDFCIKIHRCKALAAILMFLTEIYKMDVYRSEIETVLFNLQQSITISYQAEQNMVDKKLLENMLIEVRKTISTVSIFEEIQMNPLKQLSLGAANK